MLWVEGARSVVEDSGRSEELGVGGGVGGGVNLVGKITLVWLRLELCGTKKGPVNQKRWEREMME